MPLDGDASYAEIAKKVNLPEEVVTRLLEHALTVRLFAKSSPGRLNSRICHNSRSATMAKNTGLRSVVSTTLNNSAMSMACLPKALEKFHYGKDTFSRNMRETAFAYAYSGGEPGKYENTWDFIENDEGPGDKVKGWRQKAMVESMRWMKESLNMGEAMKVLTDWEALGNAKVVDVSFLSESLMIS